LLQSNIDLLKTVQSELTLICTIQFLTYVMAVSQETNRDPRQAIQTIIQYFKHFGQGVIRP
jgi:RAB protein geranylgeranyltransferase component A